jgi:3-hydroxymyristoyl/3-hydroxydecanoyl-(acyl carrier protein) dehydratase
MPLDAQGKKKKEDIQLLFSGENDVTESAGFGGLEREKVIEKTENSVSLEFFISDTSPYFDGHFTGFPILPAVAQAELVLRFAARYFGTAVSPLEIKRVKFTNFIRPFTPLLLKLVKKEKTISFNMSSPENDTVYSTGTVILGE